MTFQDDPEITDEEAAEVCHTTVAAFRKRVNRGVAPIPVSRGRWNFAEVWKHAVDTGARSLDECPLDTLHAVLGALRGRFFLRRSQTAAGGITQVEWTHTDARFTIVLLFCNGSASWERHYLDRELLDTANPSPRLGVAAGADIAVIVGSEYKDSHLMTRALNLHTGRWRHVSLQQVAIELGGPIPYWPEELRHVAVAGLERYDPLQPARVALPENEYSTRLHLAATAIRASNRQGSAELSAALRARADEHVRRSIGDAVETLETLRPVTLSGPDQFPERYLFPVVVPATVGEAPEDLWWQLHSLAWNTPVGVSDELRGAAGWVEELHDPAERGFVLTEATSAQANMRHRMVAVADDDATLAHLQLAHSCGPDEVDRVGYFTDPISGAAAAQFADGWVDYVVPQRIPKGIAPVRFDVSVPSEPFVWVESGDAVPLAATDLSGFSVGYGGSGPMALTHAIFSYLGLPVPDRMIDFPWYTGDFRDSYLASEFTPGGALHPY